MALPDYYRPERVGTVYSPNVNAATVTGNNAGLKSSSEDKRRVYLLLIDVQVDFVHPDGALYVPGALDDTRRTVEWIYHHAGEITTIGASLDSHLPIQIFHPAWWQDADGNHPNPFTVITSDEVKSGKWKALYMPDWSLSYTEKLEENARKTLMVWPYHCLVGTPGHTLVPALYEAIAYHTAARQSQPDLLTKGMIPQTENYSIMEPEVKVPQHPNGDVNRSFMDNLAAYDLIYVAGQAKSHCVLETVSSMMRYYPPQIIEKMRVLSDGMSSVAHPEIDFDALADAAFGRFQENGLRFTNTKAAIG